VRMHGPQRWYRHGYTIDELGRWAEMIDVRGAKRAWIYFNNDYQGHAPHNAMTMRRLLAR
jgi:uncharacterized protein YecE (DUF72 family)